MSFSRGRNEEREEPSAAAGVSDSSMMSPDFQISPEGMKLRSGKKKRRRSRETTGLTPPDEAEKKKRRLLGLEDSNDYTASQNNEKLGPGTGTNTNNNDDDDDDSYTDDEDDQEMYGAGNILDADDSGTKLPAASAPSATTTTTGTAIASSATSSSETGSPLARVSKPMPNLRIPSEQTPGRPVVTEPIARQVGRLEPSRILHFDAPTSPSLQPPPPLRQHQTSQLLSTAGPHQMQSVARETGRMLETEENSAAAVRLDRNVPPLTLGAEVGTPLVEEVVDEEEEGSKCLPDWAASLLSHTAAWIFGILVLQVLFPSFFMHPVMTTVTWVSKTRLFATPKKNVFLSLNHSSNLGNRTFINGTENFATTSNATDVNQLFKVKRGSRNRTKGKNTSRKEKPLSTKLKPNLPPKKVKVMKYIPAEPNANAERLRELTQELEVGLADSDIKAISLEIAIATARKRINQRKSELLAWSSALSTAHVTMEILAEKESRLEPQFVAHGRKNLEFVQEASGATLDTTVINTTALGLWNITIQDCAEVNFSELVDALVGTDELERSVENLRRTADSAIAAAMQDPNTTQKVREWLRSRVAQEMKLNETAVEFLDKLAAEHGVGLSLKSIQAVIQSRLEIEHADHNGLVDYASIAKGAVVVRKGVRATSSSYVDSLPLVNRVMHYSGFRFYGHGPEASLTPTFPPDALGQCWAMDNNAKDKCSDPFCGSLGTLTLRFPKPVQVSGLVVEHPPKLPSDSTSSAINSFRVTGFDDKRAWPFGTFTFDISKYLK